MVYFPTMLRISIIRPAVAALVGGVLFTYPIAVAAEDAARLDLKAGNWELTKKSSASGKMTEVKTEHCLKDGDPVPVIVGKVCKVKDQALSGDTLTWELDCPPNEKDPSITVSGGGELTGKGSSFSGKSRIEVVVGEKKIPVETQWSGKRLGDCGDAKAGEKKEAPKANAK